MSKAFKAAPGDILYFALLQLTIGDYSIEISLSGEYIFHSRVSLPATGGT